MPVWATDNMSMVTTRIFLDEQTIRTAPAKYQELAFGNALSDCLLPCTSTTFSAAKVYTRKPEFNHSGLYLQFSPIVMVSSTNFYTFTLAGLLSIVGGSMGLWLGLRVTQLIEKRSKSK